ncbi:hypothetical protein [Fibrella forsythiae]|uniref:Uncharacterized protein n=1 Tax=Fibrella forsythiae TaxID=2817061 RepID=A0ABS3JDA0_9BACT|nr:hypothetical protein [Fibrella forsythiae]MBO0947966.1 hypothetical protein [Fibrella forsythiae]
MLPAQTSRHNTRGAYFLPSAPLLHHPAVSSLVATHSGTYLGVVCAIGTLIRLTDVKKRESANLDASY